MAHPHGLVVVLDDGHLEVQSRELAQVAVGVAVLRTEHGADLIHPGVRGGGETRRGGEGEGEEKGR